jgi:hypothetical protein
MTGHEAFSHELCQYIRGQSLWIDGKLDRTQIVRRRLAGPAIRNDLEFDLLPLVEAMHSRAFDRADVHEDVVTALVRLNEPESLLTVEPLHGALRHSLFPSYARCDARYRPHAMRAAQFEILEEGR